MPQNSSDYGGRPAKVLVVDDEASICALLSATLRLTGFEVRVANGGREALAAAVEFAPDLVVLDVMMPDIDGFDVLRAVRADPRTARVPVVMFSAVSAEEMIERARAEGANDYWIKGAISAESLCAGIMEHLGQSARGTGGSSVGANGLRSWAPV